VLADHVLADALLEHQRRHRLRLQQFFVTRIGEFAVDLEGIDAGNDLLDLAVGNDQPDLGGTFEQQALLDQIIEYGKAQFIAVEHRRIDAAARHALQCVLALAQRLREFFLSDAVFANRRHAVAAAATLKIGINSEKSEREHDQRKNQLHQAFVFIYKIVHGSLQVPRPLCG